MVGSSAKAALRSCSAARSLPSRPCSLARRSQASTKDGSALRARARYTRASSLPPWAWRTSAQAVTSLLCGFLGYRTVAIALEGLTKPAAATMGGRIFATLIFAVVFALVFKYLSSKMGEIGETAPQNPWQANTLEWVAPAIPPHGNFGPTLPVVHRGPYEYSVPGESEDWAPQTTPMSEEAASAAH